MHVLEKLSISIRHNQRLERAAWLWNRLRPHYDGIVNFLGRRGLERIINGTDSILISPKVRGMSEVYEPEVWASLMSEIKSHDVVADVGTYVGLYTVALAKRVGPHGKVYAFEPNPVSFAQTKEHIRINHLEGRVELIQAAVGSSNGQVHFEAKMDESHIVLNSDVKGDTFNTVNCVTLDTIFENKRLDVMKIDIEGYEEIALRGATRLLSDPARSPRAIYIEVHPYAWPALGVSSESLLGLLSVHQYVAQTLDGEPIEQIKQYGEIIARKLS